MKSWKEDFLEWDKKPLLARSKSSIIPDIEIELDRLAKNIARLINLSPNDLILDLGCDSGLVTSRIAGSSRKTIGVDFIYKQVIESLKADNLEYLVGDGLQLSFRDSVFDKVYCNNMVHNLDLIDNGLQVIGECIRVCKDNGLILIGDVPTLEMKNRLSGIPFAIGNFMEGYKMKQLKLSKLPVFILSQFIPEAFKNIFRRVLELPDWRKNLGTLTIWYSSEELERWIKNLGYSCTVVPQDKSLWSSYARMNLIIRKNV